MRHAVIIILLLSLSFQSLVKLGVVAWYEINKQYVATVLCENKAKPQMKCNGKCYLKKQLAKAEEKSDSKSKNRQHNETRAEAVDFIITEALSFPFFSTAPAAIENDYYADTYGINYSPSIFHPPAVA